MSVQSGLFIKELERRMPNNKQMWNREELISIVMTMLFVFGFIFICIDNFDPVITGAAVQNILLIENENISAAVSALTISDLILFAILPVIILMLLLSVIGYESIRLFRKTREHLLVKRVVSVLVKYLISLVFAILILDYFAFRFAGETAVLSTLDVVLFGVLPLIVLVVLFGMFSYEIIKIFRESREYKIIKVMFLFLIRYVLSLSFIILILDFLSSKYLRLTSAVIETISTMDIIYFAIIPIIVITLIFTLLIYLLMKYVE